MSQAQVYAQEIGSVDDGQLTSSYRARKENLRSFFSDISSAIGKPIIVSNRAAAKQISGDFDLADHNIIKDISRKMGLVNYGNSAQAWK